MQLCALQHTARGLRVTLFLSLSWARVRHAECYARQDFFEVFHFQDSLKELCKFGTKLTLEHHRWLVLKMAAAFTHTEMSV
jgi:hypothetical protein